MMLCSIFSRFTNMRCSAAKFAGITARSADTILTGALSIRNNWAYTSFAIWRPSEPLVPFLQDHHPSTAADRFAEQVLSAGGQFRHKNRFETDFLIRHCRKKILHETTDTAIGDQDRIGSRPALKVRDNHGLKTAGIHPFDNKAFMIRGRLQP